ncbi:unnamed protein product (macronuclear) [Paramecium tetraurelia]|uniref:Uncharacterized protein n=1 Tax=Paramecium tetraurelia TaxID=5888 RepID=A0E2K2_PARTE|nr:uncharacterized protein GSPATT00022691001 [Paramecium tetraurelia]CAK89519.1 unnamed protein product [Paramecium tetraurelia]|eukprot:XP_001456916.1 hypothetical protein (macronuclear) [Paramecium tetraurelia strain d4-2]
MLLIYQLQRIRRYIVISLNFSKQYKKQTADVQFNIIRLVEKQLSSSGSESAAFLIIIFRRVWLKKLTKISLLYDIRESDENKVSIDLMSLYQFMNIEFQNIIESGTQLTV